MRPGTARTSPRSQAMRSAHPPHRMDYVRRYVFAPPPRPSPDPAPLPRPPRPIVRLQSRPPLSPCLPHPHRPFRCGMPRSCRPRACCRTGEAGPGRQRRPKRDETGLSLRQDVLDPGFHRVLPPGRAQHAPREGTCAPPASRTPPARPAGVPASCPCPPERIRKSSDTPSSSMNAASTP
jgi:hypothetical protein